MTAGTASVSSLSLLETLEPSGMDPRASKSLLLLLSVIGCCAGQSILPKGPVDAVLGRNVTLQTLVNKADYAFIIWNFNHEGESVNIATLSPTGLTVDDAHKGRVSINSTNGYLTLTGLKSEDSGDYSISIVSPSGQTRTGETTLRVLEPVSAVVIRSNMPTAIEQNSTVVLNCTAKGSFLKFTWINGTTPIVVDGDRLSLKEAEMSSELTVRNVRRTDLVGPIYCSAANNLQTEKSAPFNLTVYYGPDGVTISPLNPPKFIPVGSNFNLSCSARSDPPAVFTWYHGQEMMENAGPVLTLEVIQKHGLGKKDYSCRAKNEKTQRTIPSPAVSFIIMENISGTKITGPTTTLVAGNSSANLSCQATAGSVETRNWLKDGKALTPSSRLVFAPDMSSMMINVLQKEDNGKYTCQLSNPVNADEASYEMVVNYGPETPTVQGVKEVEVRHPVTLTCSAASIPPANFTWKFNGTVTSVKSALFVIQEPVYKDSGTYTCEAHNAVTGKTSVYTHTLAVKGKIHFCSLEPNLSFTGTNCHLYRRKASVIFDLKPK
ncbi:hypothetical protein L3Q82_015371 [Scortum barcoo]|uniref:Uncharacterized protein n=1 Tax=Scortum barcoo TaxID=214431 RepID=A0ACB8VUC6_9TELE|nr:hypothetical protein L3Q82_015371 [Scortum barcoo]